MKNEKTTRYVITAAEIVAEAIQSLNTQPETPTTTVEQRLTRIKSAILAAGTPGLGAQQGRGPQKTIVYVKLMDATTSWSWYVTEFSEVTDGGPNIACGLVVGFATEAGYFGFEDLAAFPNVVVDPAFKPQTLAACLKTIKASR